MDVTRNAHGLQDAAHPNTPAGAIIPLRRGDRDDQRESLDRMTRTSRGDLLRRSPASATVFVLVKYRVIELPNRYKVPRAATWLTWEGASKWYPLEQEPARE